MLNPARAARCPLDLAVAYEVRRGLFPLPADRVNPVIAADIDQRWLIWQYDLAIQVIGRFKQAEGDGRRHQQGAQLTGSLRNCLRSV